MYEGSQIEGDTEMLDSDDEPLISSKSKISEKSKSTPIKKNILVSIDIIQFFPITVSYCFCLIFIFV